MTEFPLPPIFILYPGEYNLDFAERHHDHTIVFGDNLVGVGTGGQACIRSAPNAYGVPTKRSPNIYFSSGRPDEMVRLAGALHALESTSRIIVLPTTPEYKLSLGLGLARLPEKAPLTYMFLQHWFERIKNVYETRAVAPNW